MNSGPSSWDREGSAADALAATERADDYRDLWYEAKRLRAWKAAVSSAAEALIAEVEDTVGFLDEEHYCVRADRLGTRARKLVVALAKPA